LAALADRVESANSAAEKRTQDFISWWDGVVEVVKLVD
jgi:hypothetical protein